MISPVQSTTAAYRTIAQVRILERVGILERHHARLQRKQVREIAAVQRNGRHFLRVDHFAHLCTLGFHVDGLAFYGYSLGYFAQLQFYVNLDRRVGIDYDPGLTEGLESLLFHVQVVGPNRQIRKTVEAAPVCLYDSTDTGLSIGGSHRGADHKPSGRVGHNAGDGSCNARPYDG